MNSGEVCNGSRPEVKPVQTSSGAVQAGGDGPPLSGTASPVVPRRLLCAGLHGSWCRQHLRSASRRQLIVPRVRRSIFGARAFAIAGPTVWNSLPDSLRDPAVGPDQFRRDLKTHLFE